MQVASALQTYNRQAHKSAGTSVTSIGWTEVAGWAKW